VFRVTDVSNFLPMPYGEEDRQTIGWYFPGGRILKATPKDYPSRENVIEGFLVLSSNLSRHPIICCYF
jgi:hypothetical protein